MFKKQSNKSKTESLGPNEGSSAESTKPETNMNGFTAAQQAGLDQDPQGRRERLRSGART